MKLKQFLFLKALILLSFFSYSQGIPIGQWRNHLPKNRVIAVAEVENRIYAATPYSIFYYDKSDNSIQQLTKVNGLSDVGISTIHYNKLYKTLIISYSNANIDLLKPNGIINISDIKNKSIPGNKKINSVTSMGRYAYLSCGFGIVVVDLLRNEIKDTYIIGDNGNKIEVNEIAANDTIIYAATSSGIYKAAILNPNLADYHNWRKDSLIRGIDSKFTHIVFFNDKVIICKSRGNSNSDTLFAFNGNSWTSFDTATVNQLAVFNNQLIVSNWGYYIILDASFQYLHFSQFFLIPNQIIVDKDNFFWIADDENGLIKIASNGIDKTNIIPNGPYTKNVFTLSSTPTGIWLAPGGVDYGSWSDTYFPATLHQFNDEKWTNYTHSNIAGLADSIVDILDIAIDPTDNSKIYAASWYTGIIEMTNNKVTNIYNEANSSLRPNYIGSSRYTVRVGNIEFDESGNLWATNSGVQNSLSVRYHNGTWESFDLQGLVNNDILSLMIDKNSYKWMYVREKRLVVFNKTQNSYQKAWVDINRGSDLACNYIHCFTQDLNGEIWVGTDKGIRVIYSPDDVFNTAGGDESTITSQAIKVEFDGHVQYLFEFEDVTAIVVDGANRKWIGTQKAGVFLISADGLQQLAHYTEENSPLFSNTIISIAINPQNGEIFFGTAKGIISYRGLATKGEDTFKDVYAFPNPVRPEYNGIIAIKGLVKDANVKITDIAGNLIFNTISYGGQAIWDGKNYNGERAKTGVYLVFSTNEDGQETIVTKILFIN
ncbi:MAG: hypothetical protein NTZ33_11960 [Bacteroidetes bacterium]|nr:hypothetical protein [Bacteroidota bacterium]